MARRKRRSNTSTPATVSPKTERPKEKQYLGRSTFRVSKALTELKTVLPDRLFPEPLRQTPEAIFAATPEPTATPVAQKAAKKLPPKIAVPQRDAALAEKKMAANCKGRPSKSTGNGAGRAFVPWCTK